MGGVNRLHVMSVVAAAVAVALLGVLLAGGSGLTGFFTAGTAKEKVIIAYLPVVQGLPFFLALEKGYFAEEGLDVAAVRFDAPNQIIDTVAAGQADAAATGAASGITAIAESKKPGTLKMFAMVCGTQDRLNDELLVAANSSIGSFADLKGKKLGHLPGIQFRTVAQYILKKNGVDPSAVQLVDLAVPLQLGALGSGQVDAVLTLEPVGTIGVAKGVARVGVVSPMVKYVSDPWCGGTAILSAKFMKERPEMAKRVVKVFDRAVREYELAASKQYLVKYLGVDNKTADKVPLPLIKMYYNLTDKDFDAIQKWIDVFYEEGVIQQKVYVRKMILSGNESASA